jgi:hypothetical protein
VTVGPVSVVVGLTCTDEIASVATNGRANTQPVAGRQRRTEGSTQRTLMLLVTVADLVPSAVAVAWIDSL